MSHVVAAGAALVLYGVPMLVAPLPALAWASASGVLLVALGLVTRWRWPITIAACVFVTSYAVALWLTDAAPRLIGAAGFGLAVLLLVHASELARCTRGATVDGAVARSQVVGWVLFGAATVATSALVAGLAHGIAAAVPFNAAPVLAAAAALGVVLSLAAMSATSSRHSGGGR